jgi:hypothetical protein
MNLFIQIKDGQPFEHPIPDWNLEVHYPDLDHLNPPEGFARFVRVDHPKSYTHNVTGVKYVLSEELTKELGTPTYTDEYILEPMSPEELELAQEIKKAREIVESPEAWLSKYTKEDEEGNVLFGDPDSGTWIKGNEYLQPVLDFFVKYNINPREFNYFSWEGLDDEQRRELTQIILALRHVVTQYINSNRDHLEFYA